MPGRKTKTKKKPKKNVLVKKRAKAKKTTKAGKKNTAKKSSVSSKRKKVTSRKKKKVLSKKTASVKKKTKRTARPKRKPLARKRKTTKTSAKIKKSSAKAASALFAEPDIQALITERQKNRKTEKRTTPEVIYKYSKPKISPHVIDLKKKYEVAAPAEETKAAKSEFTEIKLTETEIQEQFTKGKLFVLPFGWKRAVAAFIIIALVIAGPIQAFSHFYKLNKTKEDVMNLTQQAYTDLKIASTAVSGKDMYSAKEHFSQASKNFNNAQNQLNEINVLLQPILKIVPYEGKTLSDAENLLKIGQNVSLLGEKISDTFDYFYQNNSPITEKLNYVKEQIKELLPVVQDSANRIENINPKVIPEEFQDQFVLLKSQVHQFNKDFYTLDSFADFLLQVLGHEKKKRYLFIFQNNCELRPTGGFMGSLALVDFYKGEIENIEIPGGGPYDFQGTFYERLAPPQPLLLVNDLWQLQDANWFYNFPDSAEKIQWFYQKAGGPTVDGVIAINASLIEELLQYLPPIEMPEYNKIITAKNFINDTQKAVELEYDKEQNQPKKFISDMAPKLLESIFSAKQDSLLNVAKTLNQSFAKKEIQVYLNDQNLQNKVSGYNWSGEVKQTSKDYLSIVPVNILGGKTDHVIYQDAKLDAAIDENGYISNTLTITRKHLGDPADTFTSMANNSYLKIFVPQGSKLISAEGFSNLDQSRFYTPAFNAVNDEFLNKKIKLIDEDPISHTEIWQEADKTVFANWVETAVGQTSTIKISYMLPFRLNMPDEQNGLEKLYNYFFENTSESQFYSIFIQKHPGSMNNHITATVSVPPKYQLKWIYPDSASKQSSRTAVFESDLQTDQLFGLIFLP